MQKIRRLLFSDGHLGLVLEKKKPLTIRLYREETHQFAKGEKFYGEFPCGTKLLMEATERTKLYPADQIPDAVAREDGYPNGIRAFEGLTRFYGDRLTKDSVVAVIRFRALCHDYPVTPIQSHGANKHKCGFCGESFKDKHEMWDHQRHAHDPDGIAYSEFGPK